MAEREVDIVQKDQLGNVLGMKTRVDNALISAKASLRGIVECARYVATSKNPGGLAQAIEETSFMYNLSVLLDKRIKSLVQDEEKKEEKAKKEKEDPEKAAEKYFDEQEAKHRSTKEAKKTQMTWIVTLIDDAERQMNKTENSEWDRRFWTKVHQLALGIRDDVYKEAADAAETDRQTRHLSKWWLLLPIGVITTVIAGMRIYTLWSL